MASDSRTVFTARTGSVAYLDEYGHDEVWTPEDICDVFTVTKNVVYKLNQQGAIPYKKFGRHCRYLRSDVLSYFMSRDVDAKTDDGSPMEFRRLSLDELPAIYKRPRPMTKVRSASDLKPENAA